MDTLVYWYSLVIGNFLVPAIVIAFLLGLMALFKRHYLAESERHFAVALQRLTSRTLDEQYQQSHVKAFSEIVWEVLRKAADERKTKGMPAEITDEESEEEGGAAEENPFERGAEKFLKRQNAPKKPKTLVEEETSSQPLFAEWSRRWRAYFDRKFSIDKGIDSIIDNTLEQTVHYSFDQPSPNFMNIASYAFSYNPYFQRMWKMLTVDSANSLLKIWSELIVMLGILGTFVGFFLAFQSGNDMRSGVSVAITSSIVGMTLGILFMLIEKAYTDEETSIQSVEMLKDSLEMIWNTCKAKYEQQHH